MPKPASPALQPAGAQPAKTVPPAAQADDEYELPTPDEIGAALKDSGALTAAAPENEEEGEETVAAPEPTAAKPEPTLDEAPTAPADEGEAPEGKPEETPAEEPAPSGSAARIAELELARQNAETEVAAMREKVATLFANPVDRRNPLNFVTNEAELDAAVEAEYRLLDWAMEHEADPDGADIPDGKGELRHYEPHEIRKIKVTTSQFLRTERTRREFLAEKAKRETEATTAYPWLKAKTALSTEVQTLIEKRPQLTGTADYRLVAADAVVGKMLRTAGVRLDEKGLAALLKNKPIAAPKAAAEINQLAASRADVSASPRLAPSPGRPGVLPARLTGREAQARSSGKVLAANGDLNSVADSIAAKMRF